MREFIIEKGVLKKYRGNAADVTIPKGVTAIGEGAFERCESLCSVTLPASVVRIEEYAFWDCKNLEHIHLEENIREICRDAFQSCFKLADPKGFLIVGDVLCQYYGLDGTAIIPEGVRCIAEGAFTASGQTLTAVIFPETLRKIGRMAFRVCSRLTELRMPAGVEEIGPYAFYGCKDLKTVIIPERVHIGNGAFNHCENLADSNHMIILQNILFGCTEKEETVSVSEGITRISSGAFHCQTKEVFLPDTVRQIDRNAFSHMRDLKRIRIPNGVTQIEPYTFSCCKALSEVILPESMEAIGEGAFLECTKLKKINFPSALKRVGEGAFSRCKHLADRDGFVIIGNVLHDCYSKKEDIVIPDGVTHISSGTFSHYKILESVTIPESVCYIGEKLFYKRPNLKRIVMPYGVSKVGERAFYDLKSLEECVLALNSEDREQAQMLLRAFSLTDLAVPFLKDKVQTNSVLKKELIANLTAKDFRARLFASFIEKNESALAASLLRYLKKLPLEELDGYMEAADGAEMRALFIAYKNRIYPPEVLAQMQEIEAEKALGFREKTLADYRKEFRIVKAGDFYEITGYKGEDTTVYIPGMIHRIGVKLGMNAFMECGTLETVVIGEGAVSIGEGAFDGCYSLTCAMIPDSVQSIGKGAFWGCFSVTLHVSSGSYAETYAMQEGLRYTLR